MAAPPAYLVEPAIVEAKIAGSWENLGTVRDGVGMFIGGQVAIFPQEDFGAAPNLTANVGDDMKLVMDLEEINYFAFLSTLPGCNVTGSATDYDFSGLAKFPGVSLNDEAFELRMRSPKAGRTWGFYAPKAIAVGDIEDLRHGASYPKTIPVQFQMMIDWTKSPVSERLYRYNTDYTNITNFGAV